MNLFRRPLDLYVVKHANQEQPEPKLLGGYRHQKYHTLLLTYRPRVPNILKKYKIYFLFQLI